MEWIDDAIVLSARRQGESSAVASVLTRAHGRHAGLVRSATRRNRGLLEPGNGVSARWRGRLAEHLGTLTCELTRAVAARLLGEPDRLAGLVSACAITETALPEREPCPALFAALEVMITRLIDSNDWTSDYVLWELHVLKELGFGLDLSRCAATGRNDPLAFVSPRSGRGVSLSAGEPYRERLLRLPAFLAGNATAATPADIAHGLALTGYFLARCVYGPQGRELPAARRRLGERFGRNGILFTSPHQAMRER